MHDRESLLAMRSFGPHLVTLLVLGFTRQRLRPPAVLGVPFRREGGH